MRPLCTALLVGAAMAPGCSAGGERHSAPHATLALRAKGLALTSAPRAQLDRACRRVAGRTSAPHVLCPPLVPRGSFAVNFTSRAIGARPSSDSYLFDLSSPELDPSSGGHWIVLVAPAGYTRPLDVEHRGHRATSRPVPLAGTDAVEYRIPAGENGGGYYGGHVAVVWTHGGLDYHVSMHGYGNAPKARAIAEAMIAVLRRCAAATGARKPACRSLI